MKTYTFIIGSTDDFESLDELIKHFDKDICLDIAHNCSSYEFDVPEDCDDETVTMIGRGLAFSSDWCMDDTYSCIIEGSLDGQAEKQMFNEGVKAREQTKGEKTWNPNDPTNW